MKFPEGLSLLYYYKVNGTYNLTNSYLAQVYRRVIREGSIAKVFYEHPISNTVDFTAFIQNKDHEVFFVHQHDKDVGFFWLSKFKQKSAFIQYCFYKEYWGRNSLAIGKWCLDQILHRKNHDGEYELDVLLGLTPANNKLAISFLKKNGMTVLGKIPGIITDHHHNKVIDGLFSYKTRETTRNRSSILFPYAPK